MHEEENYKLINDDFFKKRNIKYLEKLSIDMCSVIQTIHNLHFGFKSNLKLIEILYFESDKNSIFGYFLLSLNNLEKRKDDKKNTFDILICGKIIKKYLHNYQEIQI